MRPMMCGGVETRFEVGRGRQVPDGSRAPSCGRKHLSHFTDFDQHTNIVFRRHIRTSRLLCSSSFLLSLYVVSFVGAFLLWGLYTLLHFGSLTTSQLYTFRGQVAGALTRPSGHVTCLFECCRLFNTDDRGSVVKLSVHKLFSLCVQLYIAKLHHSLLILQLQAGF